MRRSKRHADKPRVVYYGERPRAGNADMSVGQLLGASPRRRDRITRYRNTLTDVLSSVRVFWVTLTDVLGIYPDGPGKKWRPHGRF